jgi:hypothetical protein
VGLEKSVWLGCRGVFIDETAEDVSPLDLATECWVEGWWRIRWSLGGGAVRPMVVVMGGVLAERGGQMSLVGDEDPVGAFSADRAHPALRERVRAWRLRRSSDDLDAGGGEDRVEPSGELAVPVAEEEL